jgi:hypothetical protein
VPWATIISSLRGFSMRCACVMRTDFHGHGLTTRAGANADESDRLVEGVRAVLCFSACVAQLGVVR